MIYLKLKFEGNRFTTTCCSKGVQLDVISDNDVPPTAKRSVLTQETGDVDEDLSSENYSTPTGSVKVNK